MLNNLASQRLPQRSTMGTAPDLPLDPEHIFTPALCTKCDNADKAKHPVIQGLCAYCDPTRIPESGSSTEITQEET